MNINFSLLSSFTPNDNATPMQDPPFCAYSGRCAKNPILVIPVDILQWNLDWLKRLGGIY